MQKWLNNQGKIVSCVGQPSDAVAILVSEESHGEWKVYDKLRQRNFRLVWKVLSDGTQFDSIVSNYHSDGIKSLSDICPHCGYDNGNSGEFRNNGLCGYCNH